MKFVNLLILSLGLSSIASANELFQFEGIDAIDGELCQIEYKYDEASEMIEGLQVEGIAKVFEILHDNGDSGYGPYRGPRHIAEEIPLDLEMKSCLFGCDFIGKGKVAMDSLSTSFSLKVYGESVSTPDAVKFEMKAKGGYVLPIATATLNCTELQRVN